MEINKLIQNIKNIINNFESDAETPWKLMNDFSKHKFIQNQEPNFQGVHILPNSTLITGKNCTIQPSVVINGTVVLGDNVFIGSHSLIRGTVFIGNNSIIGAYNEISTSIIGNDTKISHRNDILDSVIGNNCWLTSNVSIHNVRLDLGDIKVKWRETETTIPSKFGCIIEDNVTIGVWAKIMPGSVILKDRTILGPCLISPNKTKLFKTEILNS